MNTLSRALVSLLVGVVAFLLVGTSVTVWMVRWIELSLMLGIPMGLGAGLTALAVTYTALEYRAERVVGSVTPAATRRLWTATAAAVAYVVVAVAGFALFFFGDGDDGVWVLLFGLPLAVLAGAVAGYVAARVTQISTSRRRTPSP
jgi:hypothetical protein